MKIAYLFEKYPSLTETFLAREVEALRARGFDIRPYTIQPSDGAEVVDMPPRAMKVLGRERYWRAAGQRWARQIKESGIEHIHATWANHIAEIGHFGAQESGLSWSFAAHAHDLWVEGGDLKSKLASAQFVAICSREGEHYLRQYGENVLYIPHGLPMERYPYREWNVDEEIRILSVGRMVEKKGLSILIDALPHIETLRPISLEIIGDGPQRPQLEAQIAAGRFPVTLRGTVPQQKVIEAMQNANVFVLPSQTGSDGDRDGLANVLLEAAALGVPIVTTNAGAARDLVDESTGVMVESADPREIGRATAQVFENPQLTLVRCQNARRKVEMEFDIKKNVGVLIGAFQRCQPLTN